MKKKLQRIKQFVNDHNDAYFWTCGLITGACGMYLVMHQSHTTDFLKLSVEEAKELMKDDELHAVFELPKQTLYLKLAS